MFCRSLFVFLSFLSWSLFYLSFDLRLLIFLLVSSSFSFDLLVQMLHCNLYLLIYFVNLTSNILLIGSRLGNDHLIVKGWLCYSPPLLPPDHIFFTGYKAHILFTWNISIFLQIFQKSLIATVRSDHLCFAFFRSKVKFFLPFVLSLKLFLIICGFLNHRLSVCLKFAQPIISGTFF